jgi:hypothetical protein
MFIVVPICQDDCVLVIVNVSLLVRVNDEWRSETVNILALHDDQAESVRCDSELEPFCSLVLGVSKKYTNAIVRVPPGLQRVNRSIKYGVRVELTSMYPIDRSWAPRMSYRRPAQYRTG